MTIKLVDNWPAILRHAYTVWLAELASAAALVEVIHADIVALGHAWRQAAQAMRAQRLQAKAGVRSGAIAPTLAAWAGFVAQIRAALGLGL